MQTTGRLIRDLLEFEIEELPGWSVETMPAWHLHPFWQMDVYLSGWTEVWTERGRQAFETTGDVVLFPPLTWHTYTCGSGHRRVTLKVTLGPRHVQTPGREVLVSQLEGLLLELLVNAEAWLADRSGLRELEALALAEMCLARILGGLPLSRAAAAPDAFVDRLAPLLEAIAERP